MSFHRLVLPQLVEHETRVRGASAVLLASGPRCGPDVLEWGTATCVNPRSACQEVVLRSVAWVRDALAPSPWWAGTLYRRPAHSRPPRGKMNVGCHSSSMVLGPELRIPEPEPQPRIGGPTDVRPTDDAAHGLSDGRLGLGHPFPPAIPRCSTSSSISRIGCRAPQTYIVIGALAAVKMRRHATGRDCRLSRKRRGSGRT